MFMTKIAMSFAKKTAVGYRNRLHLCIPLLYITNYVTSHLHTSTEYNELTITKHTVTVCFTCQSDGLLGDL